MMIKGFYEWFKNLLVREKIFWIMAAPPLLFAIMLVYKISFSGIFCMLGSSSACKFFESDKPKVETHDTK